MNTKVCSDCGENKSLSDYYLRNKKKDPRPLSYCKICANKRSRDFNNNSYCSVTARDNSLRKRYGITLNEYESILVEQNHQCAVCGAAQADLKRALAVDHCHSTGVVRGLLCHQCNVALGFLKEDLNILDKLAEYIRTRC